MASIPLLGVGEPAVDDGALGLGGGGADRHPAVFDLGAQPAVVVAAVESLDGFAVPWLLLAADAVQLGSAEPFGERAQRAARLDLGQLTRIAHQHQLGAAALGAAHECF